MMFVEVYGPRLRPRIRGNYLSCSSRMEEIRLRASGCKWIECLEAQKRARLDQDFIMNLSWSDPVV